MEILYMADVRDPITDLEAFRDGRREGIRDRIHEAARICRNTAELSRRSGIPDGTLRKWLKGTTEPTTSHLLAIAYASGLHPHWLLTGTGPKHPGVGLSDSEEFAYIRNLKIEASAGDGAAVEAEVVEERMAFRRDWLRRHNLHEKDLCFITARGDSMHPTIRSGDTLLVRVFYHNAGTEDRQELVHGLDPKKQAGLEGIFVLRMDDGLVVKRLQPDLKGGYTVKSDSDEYDDLQAAAKDLVIVGRVEWVGRRL